ncbi:MAG: hypothetical protein AVDCRST_MAG88-1164 [uncultured Thermomicrobiales bacterium]|uniref:Uncharacterized protein n=1 Tax=uncultured Thermomicrobiales bacterium TaxID=1645740 RepID=A0A6J4USA8_9BACT|nr:MAG: hypothetical protein AVDCRST_MAG88-1164 [uncultured Thermomicrobiales bacterium]
MSSEPTGHLGDDAVRLDFAVVGEADAARVEYDIVLHAGGEWVRAHEAPFAQRWLVLRAEHAAPVTLDPAWQPGREETNFAWFQTGEGAGPDPFRAAEVRRVALDRVEQVDAGAVRCASADGALEVTWRLAGGGRIGVTFAFTPPRDGWYSVGFQAFAGLAPTDVGAICAGPFLNERRFPVVPGVLPETHLPTPVSLLETIVAGRSVTWALAAVPGDDESAWRGLADARFALGARNDAGELQPHFFAPVLGCAGSHLRAGETVRSSFLLQARVGDWWDGYQALVREVYGLRSYRENHDGSLTDAFHNLLDLLMDERFGGWQERGKGLANIEHDQSVKVASPGAILSAGLVTGDAALLRARALPIIEFSLSRSYYGFTWEFGSKGWVDEYIRQAEEDLGGPAWDAPVLVALHELARGYTPALGALARQRAEGVQDFYIRRSDFQVSLARYQLTGEAQYLERARAEADAYIAARVATPATDTIEGQRFSIHIGPDWISLLDLYEETGDRRYLAAAEAGARWFVTLLSTAPPPPPGAMTTTQRVGPAFGGSVEADHNWAALTAGYPRRAEDIPAERVPAWLVSPNGMGFEAWSTFYGGRRWIQNPAWAPYLLRLARHGGDEFFRDVAENGITGRFSNYPGYYMSGPIVAQMRPDFPYLGPNGLTSIYYHHIAPQLGLTLDWLVEQATYLSGGRIAFPAARDDSYVHFRHHLYGHAPGRFFGHEGAWLWMPRGLVEPGSPLLNWIAAEGGDRLFVALVNTSREPVSTTVRFGSERIGIDRQGAYAVDVHLGDGVERHQLRDAALPVAVPPRGLVALVLHGVRIDEPLHRFGPVAAAAGEARVASRFVTLAHEDEHLGTVRAAIVAVGPQQAVAYVFSTAGPDRVERAILSYREGGEWRELTCPHFPFEFSVPVTEPGAALQIRLAVVDRAGRRHVGEVGELRGW